MGTIQMSDGHYMIEPHLGMLEDVSDTQLKPHIIYKLQQLPQFIHDSQPCGLKGKWSRQSVSCTPTFHSPDYQLSNPFP